MGQGPGPEDDALRRVPLEGGKRDASQRDDAEVAAAYRRGVEWAFEEVEGWVRGELRRRYPRLRDDLDDLCQTVHEKLLTNLRGERFQGSSSLRTYVTSIALHTATDRLRQLYQQRALTEQSVPLHAVSEEPNPYGRVEQLDETRLLHQVLQSLPASCRELWQLVFVDRLSYEEVGARLSIPQGTVKSRMWHCRRKATSLVLRLKRRTDH